MPFTENQQPLGLGEQSTAEGYRLGLQIWRLLPRPLRLLDRQGIAAEARLLCMALGELLAALTTGLYTLRRNRHPATAEEWALPHLGWERWLPQLPGETVAQWRFRLREAWPLHQEGGTNAGVLRALGILGFPDAEIQEYSHLLWNLDGSVLFDGSRFLGSPWGSWAHFSVALPGVTALSADVVTRIVAAANKAKAGHAKLFWVKGKVDLRLDGTWTLDGTRRLDGESIVLWEGA